MTPEQRQECQRFVELQRAATEGPWDHKQWRICHGVNTDRIGVVCDVATNKQSRTEQNLKNADLIAASRTVPVAELLAENAALREKLKALDPLRPFEELPEIEP